MRAPVNDWISNWETERNLIAKLPFVVGKPSISLEKIYEQELHCVFVDIKVDFPANGPVCKIKPVESPAIVLPRSFPNDPPYVLIRHDFPQAPHLSSRKNKYRSICLTRQDNHDWWQGKTFGGLIKDIYDWLCDAAAGKLIKDNDPFEPLIASGSLPVEINSKEAQQNCAKHEGSWRTYSEILPVQNRTHFRFRVSGKGDVPTQVWYQEQEQVELWLDPPSDVEELLNMAKKVGFDSDRIRYWIERGKKQLLLVFGIKRPREVLGRLNPEEWIAFFLTRDKAKERCKWKISTHFVLESFNKEIAAVTSGFENKQKNVLIIGAGAIGSEIAESLVRSGTVKLTIIDNDSLRPHNLARHTLDARDLGEFKSESVAAKLNSMFSVVLCKPITRDFLAITTEEAKEIIKDNDLVINASASLAVQSRLSEVMPSGIAAITCFQINRGSGTVMLFSPNVNVAHLDMCEAMLITRMKDVPIINRWFEETGEAINIGGGCRSITSKIAGSIVKFGSGWLADKVLRYLNDDEKMPKEAFAEILEYNYDGNGKVNDILIKIESSFKVDSGDWKIITNASVIDKINQLAEAGFPNETGGIMIGRLDRQKKVAIITDAWKAPNDSKFTTTGFSRGLAGLKNKIAMLEDDTNDYLSYVGEWHSHPPACGTGLSSVDSPTAKRMAKELEQDRVPAICLITNSKDYATHVVK
jgi:molybdopterin/thiamine biosynthesis adenylyltransferase